MKIKAKDVEYERGKARWEKGRKTVRYQRLWRKFQKTGKCELTRQELFQKYGTFQIAGPESPYTKEWKVNFCTCPMGRYHPSVVLTSPFHPFFSKDGKIIDRSHGCGGDEDIPLEIEYSKRDLEEGLKSISVEIDLTRNKETVFHELGKLLYHFYLARKKAGLENKTYKLRKPKARQPSTFSRQDKISYLVHMLRKEAKLSLAQIKAFPRTPAQIKRRCAEVEAWDHWQREAAVASFSRSQNPEFVNFEECRHVESLDAISEGNEEDVEAS